MRDIKWVKRIAGCAICIALVFACILGGSMTGKNSQEIGDRNEDTGSGQDPEEEINGQSPSEALWEEGQAGSLEEPTAGLASHIVVDAIGYDAGEEKTAYFFGGGADAVFYVVREEDKSIVFEGRLEKAGENEPVSSVSLNEPALTGQLCRGDFTDLEKPGTYYIQTPVIGRSESFRISEDLYGDIAEAHYKDLQEKSGLFQQKAGLSEKAFEEEATQFFLSVLLNHTSAADHPPRII